MNIPLLAGTVSTVLFAASMLPMLLKAVRTKDLASYSVGNMALTNVANAVHSFYVFDLPAVLCGCCTPSMSWHRH